MGASISQSHLDHQYDHKEKDWCGFLWGLAQNLVITILKINLYTWGFVLVASLILHLIFGILYTSQPKIKNVKSGRKTYASTEIYQRWTHPGEKGWFTIGDTFTRFLWAIIGFYIALLTQPYRFTLYNWRQLQLWYNSAEIAYYMIFLPLMPFTCIFFETVIQPTKIALGMERDFSAGKGGCFFAKPKGFLSCLFWDCHSWLSLQVGQFFIVGTHSRAIQGTYQDDELDKFYWRNILQRVGANLAPELARWDGKGKLVLGKDQAKKAKVLCKASDQYLGMGDNRIYDYDPVNKFDELYEFMQKTYPDQPALIMDFVKPSTNIGVHTYDLLTMTKPDGSIQIVSSLLWADCGDSDTSHDCNSGLSIDLATGKICGGIPQYTAFFAEEKNQNKKMWGKSIKLIEEACQKAIEGHKLVNKDYNWCPAIGWDCMLDEDEKIVFFEGNQASGRLPYIMFLNLSNLIEFVQDFFWPFDDRYSVQPLHTEVKTD